MVMSSLHEPLGSISVTTDSHVLRSIAVAVTDCRQLSLNMEGDRFRGPEMQGPLDWK